LLTLLVLAVALYIIVWLVERPEAGEGPPEPVLAESVTSRLL
jgi:hypothetical protein